MNFHEQMKFMYNIESFRTTNNNINIYRLPIELIIIARANNNNLTNGYYVFNNNNIITIIEIYNNNLRIVAFSKCRNYRYYYIYIHNIDNKNLLRLHMYKPNNIGTFEFNNQTYSSSFDSNISNFEKTIKLNNNYGGFILTNELSSIHNNYNNNYNKIFIDYMRRISTKNVALYNYDSFCNYKTDYKKLKDNNYLEKIDDFIEKIK